ncbi:MAG: glucose-6-phosphate isomerase [Coriobacteriia bacterium]|nr:glucose-6-phosphate isomerase [Coriobacteriia bacterium]MCL2749722.1 glucose-6-phosphate isomerase [Coriobacteriia bacterium]
MNPANNAQSVNCIENLIAKKAASRLQKKDASLYKEIADEAQVKNSMGWADLASSPPFALDEIAAIAGNIRQEGLDAVVLIGQGGSSQASMTITSLYKLNLEIDVAFYTLDSLSPVFVKNALEASDPARTLYIVSSKSGSTIEPLMLERVVWAYVSGKLGSAGAAKRFVAITDPGSKLEQMALVKDYRYVLSSPSDVGGRFSALCVFALFPCACAGIDIKKVVAVAAQMEQRCAEDSADNPALDLACFIFDNYQNGRDKIAFVTPQSGAVFGLWLEQLIAESTGKLGKGILPYIETDTSLLQAPHEDKLVIAYSIGNLGGFEDSLKLIDPSLPFRHYRLESTDDLFGLFIVWEYVTALVGLLMEINPFDQPDVEDTKKRVRQLLLSKDANEAQPASSDEQDLDYLEFSFPGSDYVSSLRVSKGLIERSNLLPGEISVDDALKALFNSISSDDYFSIHAFVPYQEGGQNDALERMRHCVANGFGVAACQEIGPRYLHSTGQLHKGGPDNGVFCYISTEEDADIAIPDEDFTLGMLAATQAQGDFIANASRGRRAIHIHLADSSPETLNRFADHFCLA